MDLGRAEEILRTDLPKVVEINGPSVIDLSSGLVVVGGLIADNPHEAVVRQIGIPYCALVVL